jgi:hypothetical protein
LRVTIGPDQAIAARTRQRRRQNPSAQPRKTPREVWPTDTRFGNNTDVVSISGGGGGGGALASPAGILILLVVIAVVAAVWWVFNR